MIKKINKFINQGLILALLIGPIVPVTPIDPPATNQPVRPIGFGFNQPVSLMFSASIGPIFSLGKTKATVRTKDAIDITKNSASLKGEITDTGAYSNLEAWFDYGTSKSYGQITYIKYNVKKSGDILIPVSDLSSCTLYHFRAVVKNDSGISHGVDKTFKTNCPSFNVRMSVKNLSRGDTIWYESLKANPSDELIFKIEVGKKEDDKVKDIMARVNLASNIIYQGDLKVDDNPQTKNITAEAVSIGDISENKLITVTFKGKVASESNFRARGTIDLTNTVLVYNNQTSNSDNCKIMITRGSNAANIGMLATEVSTGITAGILNSILFPALLAFLIVWVFKSKFIGLDKLIEERKREIIEYRAKKELEKKINQIRDRIL